MKIYRFDLLIEKLLFVIIYHFFKGKENTSNIWVMVMKYMA